MPERWTRNAVEREAIAKGSGNSSVFSGKDAGEGLKPDPRTEQYREVAEKKEIPIKSGTLNGMKRIRQLDTIRGVAVLAVFIHNTDDGYLLDSGCHNL